MSAELTPADSTPNAATDQPVAAAQLKLARAALERGDYGQVIRLLLPPDHQPGSGPGPTRDPEVLLLLATAWMGQGRSQDAVACCRRLRACADPTLRCQASELQKVLEAPPLQRPREWSLTLPELNGSEPSLGRQLGPISRRRRPKPPAPPAPAVGPTRAPVGFAVVVIVLVLLGLLLGGCGSVRSELRFTGAGRAQLIHHLPLNGPAPAPWQRQLGAALEQQGFSSSQHGRELQLRSAVLPSRQALDQLARSASLAAAQSDLQLPPPQLQLRSRNWLLALEETYDLQFDLSALDAASGLDLSLVFDPLQRRDIKQALPLPLQPPSAAAAKALETPALVWPLQLGSDNRLVLHRWRWNPLGLGAVAVALVLALSLTLQHLRRVLGFGLPELPG